MCFIQQNSQQTCEAEEFTSLEGSSSGRWLEVVASRRAAQGSGSGMESEGSVSGRRRRQGGRWCQRAARRGGSASGRWAARAGSRRAVGGGCVRVESGTLAVSRRRPATAASGRAAAAGRRPGPVSSSYDRAIVTIVKAYEWAIAMIYGIQFQLP
jgi:hypothetical protein